MNHTLVLPRGRILDFGSGFLVMGVLNRTPDSFHPASRLHSAETALARALAMEAEGAAIVDIGGESTRPGAPPVSADLEMERILPAVAAIRARLDIAISVDTRKASVARAALDAGADIVNDISALGDPLMPAVVRDAGAALILMHMQGEPATMQVDPHYPSGDCPGEVAGFLLDAAGRAEAAGIPGSCLALDPGIGFGKRLGDNLALLSTLSRIAAFGYPMVVGLSRKRFVGELTGRDVADRLPGSLGAACAALAAGATIFRTHDVGATHDALRVFAACRAGTAQGLPR